MRSENASLGFQIEEPGTNVREYLEVLLAAKWIVLLIFLLVAASSIYYVQTLAPRYEAMTVLMREPENMATTMLESIDSFYDSQRLNFVADLRAPTPSAAAELVVPRKAELERRCTELSMALRLASSKYIENRRVLLDGVSKRLIHPKKKIQELRLRVDDFTTRLFRLLTTTLLQRREQLAWKLEKLDSYNPLVRAGNFKQKLKLLNDNMLYFIKISLGAKQAMLRELTGRLQALSPEAILARGYSITRTIPDAVVVRDSQKVNLGQNLEVKLYEGALTCRVEGKFDNDNPDVRKSDEATGADRSGA